MSHNKNHQQPSHDDVKHEEKQRVDCTDCGATGLNQEDRSKQCDTCKGTGKVKQ